MDLGQQQFGMWCLGSVHVFTTAHMIPTNLRISSYGWTTFLKFGHVFGIAGTCLPIL